MYKRYVAPDSALLKVVDATRHVLSKTFKSSGDAPSTSYLRNFWQCLCPLCPANADAIKLHPLSNLRRIAEHIKNTHKSSQHIHPMSQCIVSLSLITNVCCVLLIICTDHSLYHHLGTYGNAGAKTPVWPDLGGKVFQPPPIGENEYQYINVAALSESFQPTQLHL